MIRIAIFASGSGSNAEVLINHFRTHSRIEVVLVLTNNSKAGVIDRARRLKVPFEIFSNHDLNSGSVLEKLVHHKVDFIVLAGFLLKIPANLIAHYPDRIVNLHPALLPDFGGKGMYGMHVHKAVLASDVKETGITIHLVNEVYDDGKILFQATIPVNREETPEELAGRIHELEHRHYPEVVEGYLSQLT